MHTRHARNIYYDMKCALATFWLELPLGSGSDNRYVVLSKNYVWGAVHDARDQCK
jgi:hypothetical protein